jgi:serine/threonine protein kinase
MISPEDRFWIVAEAIRGNEHRGYIIDWDQRRWYMVCGPKTLLRPEEEKQIVVLKRYINQLPPNAHTITVDDNGLLVSVSTNPEDDPTLIPYYPRYSDPLSLQDCLTIKLSGLTELDRFGPGVDLMSYTDKNETRKVAFKYSIIVQWAQKIWEEMHLVKSFRHPNLVPFDRVVIDDAESRVLGFTTKYIPGGTLDQNRTRVFLFEWLQQLTAVVDYLNLELGVVHQDIAPRNLLIDPTTNKILLFDFDRAAPASKADPARNDVTGVIFTLYEIITEDGRLREVPFEEQDPQQVLSVEEWPVRCSLDSNVARFREHLNDWVRRRTTDTSDGLHQVDWPATHDIPPPSPLLLGHRETGEPIYRTSDVRRRSDALEQRNVVFWERPTQQQVSCSR